MSELITLPHISTSIALYYIKKYLFFEVKKINKKSLT